MRRIRRNAWVFACVSGVLQVLIFPKPSFYILSWVALAPLIYAILKCREQDVSMVLAEGGQFVAPATPWQGFLLSYASGVIWYLGSCYWIFHVMHSYGGLGALTSAVLLVLFALYLGLYHGLFGLLLSLIAARRNTFNLRALVLTPFAWVAVELARTYVTGFPWDLLGTTQVDNIPLARIATVTGVYGISFEIALVNTGLAAAFLLPYARRKIMLTAALAAAALLHAGRLVKFEALPTSQGATLVQADVPILDSGSWTLNYLQQTLGDLSALSVRPAAEHADTPGLIIWPEAPAPFFTTDYHLRLALGAVVRRADSSVIAGTLGITHYGDPNRAPELYNSASVIARDGSWTAQYDKVHLVPFGEYIPVAQLLSFAQVLTHEVGTFQRGTRHDPLTVDGTKVGVFICYESVFPGEVRQFAENGAEVFVNISNDGWFGDTGAPRQHLNMARMRSVENKRWLLRDTNTGITAVIDPLGRVVKEARRNQRTALQGAYDVEETTTFYTRHGDWFPLVCAIITLVGVLLHFRPRAPVTHPQVA